MSKKTKVLFLLEAFDKGGIEKVTLDIVNNLDPEKYDITVQTFWFGGHCQSLVKPHVKVIPFFFRRYVKGIIRLIDHLSPKTLYRLFVHGDYDVEIACSDGGAAKVISGSTNKQARKVCWVHMDVVQRGSKLREFANAQTARPIYEKFDTIACVSSTGLSQFRKKFGEYPHMCTVHNPLPDHEIRQNAAAHTPEWKDCLQFVTVGRLAVEKGFDRLIEAAGQLYRENERFQIHIVGDGQQLEDLSSRIHRHGLEDVVMLEGFQANPHPYIAAADWYVCSSLDEAFPLTVGEAFILGRPVLGTECTGILEWLGDNQYGLVVHNSTDGIYQGLKQILHMDACEQALWRNRANEKSSQISFRESLAHWEKVMMCYRVMGGIHHD